MKKDWETDGTYHNAVVDCPVCDRSCPYCDKHFTCHIEDPADNCDDFGYESMDEWYQDGAFWK